MSNFSKPLKIPNENTFSFCRMFCYIKRRLAKNHVKKISSKPAVSDTDWTTAAIPKLIKDLSPLDPAPVGLSFWRL